MTHARPRSLKDIQRRLVVNDIYQFLIKGLEWYSMV